MPDELRKRYQALRAELRSLERQLADSTPADLEQEMKAELAKASEFVVLIDDEGRIVHNNRRRPGVPELTGRSILDFIAEPYHAPLQGVIERAKRLGHPCQGRIDARGGQGTTGAYHLWAIPLATPVAGATTTLIGFEASHLQRVEVALQDQRSAVHSLTHGMPDTIIIVNPEHRVTYANHVTRIRMEDVMGADVVSLAPEASRARVREAIEAVFAGKPRDAYETQVDLASGTYWYLTRVSPITRDGEVVRVCLVSTEITELRRRELELREEREALAQSEARFRTLVDHAPEALVILDVDTHLFIDANDRACELFGYEREELVRRGPLDLSPPTQPDAQPSFEAGWAHIRQALASGSVQFEWVHRHQSGRDFVCDVRLAALPHQSRRLLRGSLFDISARKRTEKEHLQLQKELFQAQKMQAIGQLTGGVAHDFNNLLTVMMSHAELLKLHAQNGTRVVDHADQIVAAATRAASLTQQLLAFARRQPLKPQAVDLTALVAHMQRLLTRTLGETIAVKTQCMDTLWVCQADPTQLENALLNLAINARDAMPRGGTLLISMQNRTITEASPNPDVRAGRYVEIAVEDEGTGMAAEVAAQAFEPFFTTKEVGRGSGLGLSMVYGFAKQSGGHVSLSTTPEKGTRVTLYLPAERGPTFGTGNTRGSTEAARGGGECILVVEDDPAVRASTVQTLEHLGYRTLDATDATSALEALAGAEDVALVLTDVVLTGGTSGVQLARLLMHDYPTVPVTFMSGYARDVIAVDGEIPEDVHLLQKPFVQGELAAAVRSAIRRPATSASIASPEGPTTKLEKDNDDG